MVKQADKVTTTALRGKPNPPKHLHPLAKQQFRRVAKLLDQAGLLSQLDRELLVQYSTVWLAWRQAQDQIRVDGIVIKNGNGCIQKNPAWNISIECTRQLDRFMTQMGMNPAARSKLKVEEEEEANPWDDV